MSDTDKNTERQPATPPPRPKRVAESNPPPRPKRNAGSPPPRPQRGNGSSSSGGRSRTLSKRTLILGGGGLLCVIAIVAGLRSLLGFGDPSETNSKEFTGAEVAELVRLLMNDPDLQADYLNLDGPVNDSSRMIPYPLWKALLAEPHTRTTISNKTHWIYVANDGQVGITLASGVLGDKTPIPWIRVWTIDNTVSVSGETVDRERLRALALRMKRRIDAELESSGALARLEEQRQQWEQEQAERSKQLAEKERQQKIKQAESEEERQQQKDRIAAEKDSWNLKDALPVGSEKDAFAAQSDDWITRRAAVITESRSSGTLSVRENPAFGGVEGFGTTREYIRDLPLPTKEAVSTAISDGKPIPVVGAGAIDATIAQKQTPPPPAADSQSTADAGTSIKPEAATHPIPDVPTSKPPTSSKTREQQIAELTKKALNKRVSLTAPYPASYKGAPRDKMSVQYAVMEVAKQAGFQYDFKSSFANTNPICRNWVRPKIRNQTCRQALQSILRPVGLTYQTVDGVIVLERR